MKCYELQGPSGIDGLTLVDKPVAQPGERQVLVRLKAATLNYRDLLIIKGGYGSRQKFPLVPLSDGAGVIEAVGSCVREFAVGDRVIGSFFESCKSSQTADVIDKSFLRRTALCSRGARATARQRAGREVQVMPRSLYRRSSFAAPVRAFGPLGFQPATKRAWAASHAYVSAEINF